MNVPVTLPSTSVYAPVFEGVATFVPLLKTSTVLPVAPVQLRSTRELLFTLYPRVVRVMPPAGAVTVTDLVVLDVAPTLSVTVSPTVYVPAAA